jgi:DNA-directed RNA polymerase specialized sigma24 family protein
LELLPLEERQALAMALLGGMNHQEIARALGQSSPTIKQRIFNGLKHLRSFDRTAS